MPNVTPHLWFDSEAKQAADFYCSVFPDTKIIDERVYENAGPSGEETVLALTFEVAGQRVMAINGGPEFKFNESFSFFVECDTQEEVDDYWTKLTADGGEESWCGWLKDKFGLSWQIVPALLDELLTDDDPERAQRVMHAMLQMRKIDCAALQAAYDEVQGYPAGV
jgi:predicted 3-demethylubiquinone-9 3-methyltransferase (glyoxalase superfamily)